MTAEVGGVQAKIEEQVRRKTAELERVHKTLLQLAKRWRPSASWRPRWRTRSTIRCSASSPMRGWCSRELLKHEHAGARRAGRAAADHRAGKQALRRPGEEPADVLAAGAQPPRAQRSEHRGATARWCWCKHKLEMQNIELRRDAGGGPAAGRVRRQPDPAGGAGADGECLGSHAQGRRAGSGHGVRRRGRAGRRCG